MTDRAPITHRFGSVAMGTHAGIEATGLTNVGRSRPGNEDAFLIATLQRSSLERVRSTAAAHGAVGGTTGTVLMVADVTGGERAGELSGRVMGTILTTALLLSPVLYVAHVGDTRCYLLRAGRLSRLTVAPTVVQGVLAEARVNRGLELHHVLWSSLGGKSALPEPRFVRLELELGDRLLLCSSGLTEHLADTQIVTVLSAHQSGSDCCTTLLELAGAVGGSDNVTALVADVRRSTLVMHRPRCS